MPFKNLKSWDEDHTSMKREGIMKLYLRDNLLSSWEKRNRSIQKAFGEKAALQMCPGQNVVCLVEHEVK